MTLCEHPHSPKSVIQECQKSYSYIVARGLTVNNEVMCDNHRWQVNHYSVTMVIELMHGEHSNQNSFIGMICEDLIPADHLLRKLTLAMDSSFVCEVVSDCYCSDKGLRCKG